jgi:hypothetical protein
MLQKLFKIYPWQIELIPLFLLVLIFYLSYSSFGSLPDRIPTHFDFQGRVDGWGDKSGIMVYPITALLTFALFTGINIALSTIKDPKRLINLPSAIKDRLTPENAERLRIIMVRCLLAVKILVLGQLLYTLNLGIGIAQGQISSKGDSGILIFTVLFPLVIGYMIYKIFRLAYSR